MIPQSDGCVLSVKIMDLNDEIPNTSSAAGRDQQFLNEERNFDKDTIFLSDNFPRRKTRKEIAQISRRAGGERKKTIKY
jgi:hypothetical protein